MNQPRSPFRRVLPFLVTTSACAPAGLAPGDSPADPDAAPPAIVLAPVPESPPDDDGGVGREAGAADGVADAAPVADACPGGACQPWQVNPGATGRFASRAPFATDGTAVVWPATFSNGVEPWQVAADGSSSTPIALGLPASDAIVDIAMAASFVFWTSTDGSMTTLWQAREGGSASAAALATFGGTPRGLVVDAKASYVVFDTVSGSMVLVHQCNVASSVPSCSTLTGYTSSQPGALVADESAVYWTDPGNGVVARCALAGGAATTLAHDQHNPGAIALDDDDVFWTADAVGGGLAIDAVSKGAGGAQREVATGPSAATGLATDGVDVYVGVPGTIQSVPVAGGVLTTLTTSADVPIDLTCVGGTLYWATSGAAGVYGMRVRSP